MPIHRGWHIPVPAWIFLGLAFGPWGVYLAGLIGMQITCNDPTTGSTVGNPAASQTQGLNTEGLAGVYGWSGNVLTCNQLFRYYWFIMGFSFLTLLGTILCLCVPKRGIGTTLHFTRWFWIGMLCISIVLMMISSEAFLASIASSLVGSTFWHQLATAGAIASAAALIMCMFTIGTFWEHSHVYSGASRYRRREHEPRWKEEERYERDPYYSRYREREEGYGRERSAMAPAGSLEPRDDRRSWERESPEDRRSWEREDRRRGPEPGAGLPVSAPGPLSGGY